MGRSFRAARAAFLVVAGGLVLASCAHVPIVGRSDSSEPRRTVAISQPRPHSQASAPAWTGVGDASLWNLRAGLNVAALQCRRTHGLQGDYERTLTRHKELFAATYEAERRRGGSGFDSEQTRIYNRFANQRSPARFCEVAAGVAQETSSMDSPRLVSASPSLLARLESGRY